MHKTIIPTKLIHSPCDIHIGFTIFGNFIQFAVFVPFHGFQAVRSFGCTKRRFGNRIQTTNPIRAYNVSRENRAAEIRCFTRVTAWAMVRPIA